MIADNITRMFNPIFTIKVRPDAAKGLREAIAELVEPYKCKPDEAKDKFFCADTRFINKELGRILRDGQVDYLESPRFYQLVSSMAGEDHLLEANEVSAASIKRVLTEVVATSFKDISNEFSSSIAVPTYFSGSQLASALIFDRPAKKERLEFLGQLVDTKNLLDKMVRYVEADWRLFYKKEVTDNRWYNQLGDYFSFIRPSNLFGLSARLSSDCLIPYFEKKDAECAPFSAMEMDGASDFLQELYKIQAGCSVILARVSARGPIPLENEHVKAFLASPFADAVNITHWKCPAGCEVHDARVTFYSSVVKMTKALGAERLADLYAKEYAKKPGLNGEDVEKIYSSLPKGVMHYLDSGFREFADVAISLDSIALMLTGGVIGVWLGKAVKGAEVALNSMSYVARTARSMSFARRYMLFTNRLLLPGINVFAKSALSSSRWVRGAAAVGNLFAEIVKMNVWMQAAYNFGGKDVYDIAGKFFVFTSTASAAFSAAARKRLADMINSKAAPNAALDRFMRRVKDVNRPEAQVLKKELSLQVNGKTFDAFWKQRLKTIGRERAARSEAVGLFKEAKAMVRENGGILGQEWQDRFIALAKKRDIKGLRAHVVSGRQMVKVKAKAAARAAAAAQTAQNLQTAAMKKGAPRVDGAAVLQRNFRIPPKTLSAEDVHGLTGGRVQIAEDAKVALADFYAANPDQRAGVWRVINQLSSGRMKGLRKVKVEAPRAAVQGQPVRILSTRLPERPKVLGAFEARIGEHRIYIQQVETASGSGGHIFELTKVERITR